MRDYTSIWGTFLFTLAGACTVAPGSGSFASESETGESGESDEDESAGSASESGDESSEDTDGATEGGHTMFDVGFDDTPHDICKVAPDDADDPIPCEELAPPDSFDPEVQWSWTGPAGEVNSIVTPLVANLTDDDENDEIDLCDVPDVVAISSQTVGGWAVGHVYVLDGETGAEHAQFSLPVSASVNPALGDIDGDGLVEIVAVSAPNYPNPPHLVAFNHDGSMLWNDGPEWAAYYTAGISLADLDADGDVEIIAGNLVLDHEGNLLWSAPEPFGRWPVATAADLDLDGDLEVVLGASAFHHDGSVYFDQREALFGLGLTDCENFLLACGGYPQIVDFDDDDNPEIVLTTVRGLARLEHDGTVVFDGLKPTGDEGWPEKKNNAWHRPASIKDVTGDGTPNFLLSSANHYAAYEPDGSITWMASVHDLTGVATGTAFDFLGDDTAEAIYADEQNLLVYDGLDGSLLFPVPRNSLTLNEYPVVADADNDGSAEIVVVSNSFGGDPNGATVKMIRDVDERWIRARRIWNQHDYHVTNVREDGTIPQHEPKSWQNLNSFRTNAQIAKDGGTCDPAG